MKILFESLLVLVPVFMFMTTLLWACLFMAGAADRTMPHSADGEDGQPVAGEDFEARPQQA